MGVYSSVIDSLEHWNYCVLWTGYQSSLDGGLLIIEDSMH